MKSQPNRNYVSNDDIDTPAWLAAEIVRYFEPSGRVLEPCRGRGNIYGLLPVGSDWCEIKEGRDFLSWDSGTYDWIVTNPPWSQIRPFLQRSLASARNVVFLMTVNHAWTKARLRDVSSAEACLKTILLVPTPREFPQSGFQLGAVHYARGPQESIKLDTLEAPASL
jgi:hypothetical protein